MKQELEIKPVDHNNFDDFLQLVDKLAEYEKLMPPDKDAKKRLKNDAFSKNPRYEAYLVEKDNQYIGYIILILTYSSFLALPTLYIEDIFLLPEQRQNGYGTKMFDFCKKIANEKKCGRIEWHVLDWNKPAINFYNKQKAVHLREWLYYRLTKDHF